MAAAERRPVPSFPGKLRKAEQPPKYDKKSRWDSTRLNTLAAPRHRPDRVFGTARSTNTNLPTGKISKLSKPLLISKKSPPKIISEDAAKISRKPAVRFQDQELSIEKNSRNISILADAPLTPKSLVKSAKSGTPYYSAKSCSNCRFDKLVYAPYWISQIKLAESVGKHFVSASFFRLAFECNAEPARSLKSELKRYLARHASLAITDVWKALSGQYVLSEERDHGLINFDCAIPPVGENLDSVIQSTKNSDFEESINSIIEEKGDADDANTMVMIPCNESSKVMIDNCLALLELPNHPGDIQCLKMGDYDVVSHQADDLTNDDLSEQKKSASACTDTSHNGRSSNDLRTTDEENISSIVEEPITGDFMNEGSSSPDNPKSTAEFDAKGVLEVKDEVIRKQRKDDSSENEVLNDSLISDSSAFIEEENKSVDSINESASSSEKSKSRGVSEVKNKTDEKEQNGSLDEEKIEIQSEFYASGGSRVSSIFEEEIKPVNVINESSSSSDKSKSTGKADKKKQNANSDKKNVKIPYGKRSTALLTKMR